ncbi:MAG: DNA-directed RNA polymerase subunit alpha [Oscillospiraceae bacterium]|jgi:DNA-directed RNA polymerase subunit alpha|nr:DNA-directed RNA polymerase subunit alpha [Oscillospiraceae bacterium]
MDKVNIVSPTIENISEKGSYARGTFIVEPLERGYGHTLGNALRRVLLSSLPGAAVTTIKIAGAVHEFQMLPGVKEDVTEIILNIKSLVIKLYSDEPAPKVLRLHAEGPGVVTGREITEDGDVEIINLDQHIAVLSDGAVLDIEMTVEHGRGYRESAKNKPNTKVVGVIPIDSIFTPVARVNYHVENTRVGDRTDYDKLTLEVYTNGSISAEESVGAAAQILVDQFSLFTNETEENRMVRLAAAPTADGEVPANIDLSIEDLDLSVRSFNCLKRANINTVAELTSKTEDEMIRVRNLGKKSLEEVIEKLELLGLSLRKDDTI